VPVSTGLNRTMVGLKFDNHLNTLLMSYGLNRTMVGLKYGCNDIDELRDFVLIALW